MQPVGVIDPSAEPLGKKPRGGGSIQPYAISPGMSLTADTTYIPVNANKTNDGPWKEDASGTLNGIPAIRDFDLSPMRDLSAWDGTGNPPAGQAIADPELKNMTASVILPKPQGEIRVDYVSQSEIDNGLIRFWTDATKTTEIPIGGVLPGYDLRMYLAWKYDGGTIYTLGYEDWRVVLKADTPPGGVLTIDAESLITTTGAVRSNDDPLRVEGEIFNTSFEWVSG